MSLEFPYIVADIGGTNARFGLVTSSNNNRNSPFSIEHKQKYPSKTFDNIDQATQHYIESLNGTKVSGACLAVAGPVAHDDVHLTNLKWKFSINQLKTQLQLKQLSVINDFAAYALATQQVSADNLISLNPGISLKGAPIAVIGPGTGFGVASLVPRGDNWSVIASEGGHIALSAQSKLQASIIQFLQRSSDYVHVESVLSGPGLASLYRALAFVEGIKVKPRQAAEISKQASLDNNSLSYRTLKLFCLWLGQIASDITVTLGARAGVYLCGGILKRNTDFFLTSDFIQGFLNKGVMQDYLNQIPVNLVTENDSALLGAAAFYHNDVQPKLI